MNESQANTTASGRKTLSISYRRSIRIALIWFGILMLGSITVLDMGQTIQVFSCSVGVYFVLLLLIMRRRPTTPSKLDLLLVGWGLPILFFSLLYLLPLAWHIRGID